MVMRELSWEPKLEGKCYCSPACGFDCTKAEYDKAHRDSQQTIRLMPNPNNWEARVWENLGWHWELRSKDGWWSVSPHGHGLDGWTAFLTIKQHDQIGGRWAEAGATPQKAMRATWDVAKVEYDEIKAAIDGALPGIGLE